MIKATKTYFHLRQSSGKTVEVKGWKDDVKTCNQCGITKSLDNYHITSTNTFGQKLLKGVCATCCNNARKFSKVRHRKKDYAFPKKDYCEICLRPELDPETGKKIRIVLDHDHYTEEHRGWLCDQCNTAVGKLGSQFSTDKEGLEAALKYLSRTPSLKK